MCDTVERGCRVLTQSDSFSSHRRGPDMATPCPPRTNAIRSAKLWGVRWQKRSGFTASWKAATLCQAGKLTSLLYTAMLAPRRDFCVDSATSEVRRTL